MSVSVRRYEKQDAEVWDRLVAESWNDTFLHTRRFFSYHDERFLDLSLVIEDDRGCIAGVFPAALDPGREDLVVSHPGLTYGGVVHKGSLKGTAMLEALQGIIEAYQAIGLRLLRYKVVPYIYHRVPSADDLYSLFRLGALRYRCDLSATIDLTIPRNLRKVRHRDLKKARSSGVKIAFGARYFQPFWAILEENLAAKHSVRPVHTLEEISRLQSKFPEQIECVVATLKDEVVAGIVLFHTPPVVHTQYIASAAVGPPAAALTAVIEYSIEKSKDYWGARYFDFGISNEGEGKFLNDGLYRFKTSFGASSVVHEFYEIQA